MANEPFTIVNPQSLARPKGYNHGLLAPEGGRLLFVAGQIGWNETETLVDGGFVPQFEQALKNVLAVVLEAGGDATNIGRLTIYVTEKLQYLANLALVGQSYREVLGKHFPAMALVEVKDLLEPNALVEIEATAVL
ncbi:MAG: RidA family protein [Planctomycetota bacterium]